MHADCGESLPNFVHLFNTFCFRFQTNKNEIHKNMTPKVHHYGLQFLNSRLPIGFHSSFEKYEFLTIDYDAVGRILADDDCQNSENYCFCLCHNIKTMANSSNSGPAFSTLTLPATNKNCINCHTEHTILLNPEIYKNLENELRISVARINSSNITDHNKLAFIFIEKSEKNSTKFYLWPFFGNSTVKINKNEVKILLKPVYKLLKNFNKKRKNQDQNHDFPDLTFKKFGFDNSSNSSCARLRIYNGESYQKNLVRYNVKKRRKNLEAVTTLFLLENTSSYPKTTIRNNKISNENDFFSSNKAKFLQKFAQNKIQKFQNQQFQTSNFYRIGISKIHGRGLICTEPIPKNTKIIEYTGEIIRNSVSDIRQEKYRKNGLGNYLFRLGDFSKSTVIDGTRFSSLAKYVNHSCDPNCVMVNYDDEKLVLQSVKKIEIGQEISYDYGYMSEIVCNCGSEKCASKK